MQVILVSPFVEEYIFRYLPCKFINKNNFISMVLLSSILFTLLHNFNSYQMILVFMSGILLFYICYKGSNMVYSFISHSVYNMCVLILAYTNISWYLVVSLVCFLMYYFIIKKG